MWNWNRKNESQISYSRLLAKKRISRFLIQDD